MGSALNVSGHTAALIKAVHGDCKLSGALQPQGLLAGPLFSMSWLTAGALTNLGFKCLMSKRSRSLLSPAQCSFIQHAQTIN